MRLHGFFPLGFFLLTLLPVWYGQAQEIRRCVLPDGQTLFTDRRCEEMGAINRLPPAPPIENNAHLFRNGCPRRLSELAALLREAIDTRNVNRLSSLYLWSGHDNGTANNVLSRLESVVRRPLQGMTPVYPARITDMQTPADANTMLAHPRPWALRLEQTLSDGHTPSPTVLQLHRQYNCFWVTF